MSHPPVILHHSPSGRPAPRAAREFAERHSYTLLEVGSPDDALARVSRAYPAALVIDGSEPAGAALDLCRRMKAEAFTSVVPVIVYSDSASPQAASAALEAGADEVLTAAVPARETDLRLELALRRAERDVSVHPTTRLPGTVQIERDFAERLRRDEAFAVCYADLDHFKEFNDRYSYYEGDRVIRILAKILHDVVKGLCFEDGFVGHIGGDDFIFIIPTAQVDAVCSEIVSIFDALAPFQYSEADRRAGYFFGKDRRGQLHRVPLMTVSIGVVTNERRFFTHAAQVSALATEMKSYAKTLPGSVFVVDRRQSSDADEGSERRPGPPR
jgi:PleD family two-component response regulator